MQLISTVGSKKKPAFRSIRLAAQDDLGAVANRLLHRSLNLLQLLPADQRAHLNVGVLQWIAHLGQLHRQRDLLDELLGNGFVDVDALGAVTNLAGVDDARIADGRGCQVKVRVLHHDGGSLATEFQRNLGDIFGTRRA